MGRKKTTKVEGKALVLRVAQSDLFGRTEGKAYRIMMVPEQFSLMELAELVVTSFGLDFNQPYGFYSQTRDWSQSSECYELFDENDEELRNNFGKNCQDMEIIHICDVFTELEKRMLLIYDYTTEWHFIIELEDIRKIEATRTLPDVIESEGESEEPVLTSSLMDADFDFEDEENDDYLDESSDHEDYRDFDDFGDYDDYE